MEERLGPGAAVEAVVLLVVVVVGLEASQALAGLAELLPVQAPSVAHRPWLEPELDPLMSASPLVVEVLRHP